MDEDNNQTGDAADDPDLMQDLPDDQLEDVQQDLAGDDATDVEGSELVDDEVDEETEPAA
jgi:hypothetical protein